MKGGDPRERNWLEIKILIHLMDAGHASPLRTISTIDVDRQEAISCSVFDLRDDGLVGTTELIGDHLVELTPLGREVLLAILSGKTGC